jgi:nucleotide-binding universal stress UspA family protein
MAGPVNCFVGPVIRVRPEGIIVEKIRWSGYFYARWKSSILLTREVPMHAIERILAPIDFSDNAGKVLQAAAYVAGAFKAHVYVVFVVQSFEGYSGFFVPPVHLPNMEEELFASAQQQMEAYIGENRELFVSAGALGVEGKVLSGDVAEEILAYAVRQNIQLIVMGTHGYKGMERIMFGSVADQIVKTACCPVMTINPYRETCGHDS